MEPNTAQPQIPVQMVSPTIQPPIQPAQNPVEPLIRVKKSFSLKWPLLIVGLILMLVLIGGAYFLGKNQNVSQKSAAETFQKAPTRVASSPTSSPTLTPNPTGSETLIATDTASWKTFSNQYLSFKYPSDLKIVDPYPDTPDQSIYIGVMPSDKTLGSSAPPIVVTRLDNPKNLDLQQWEAEINAVSARPSSYYKSTTEKTIIDNHTAYFNENANCEPYSCYQIFVMGKDNIFEFFNLDYGDYPPPGASSSQTYTRTEQNNLKTIFQEILDNVKFTQ